jgi:hypothetical protein
VGAEKVVELEALLAKKRSKRPAGREKTRMPPVTPASGQFANRKSGNGNFQAALPPSR